MCQVSCSPECGTPQFMDVQWKLFIRVPVNGVRVTSQSLMEFHLLATYKCLDSTCIDVQLDTGPKNVVRIALLVFWLLGLLPRFVAN